MNSGDLPQMPKVLGSVQIVADPNNGIILPSPIPFSFDLRKMGVGMIQETRLTSFGSAVYFYDENFANQLIKALQSHVTGLIL